MTYLLLSDLSNRLNFSFTLQENPPDWHWGDLINGTWTGMIGQIYRQEKDMTMNAMYYEIDKYTDLDLSIPYSTDAYTIVIKASKNIFQVL